MKFVFFMYKTELIIHYKLNCGKNISQIEEEKILLTR